jgi:hypothetical protein
MANDLRPGIYSVDYFSGAQTAIYIGDVLVDEVTSIYWTVQQNRVPIYGYSDQLFRTMAKGQVLIQGTFTINFKEAGYLWLILERYRRLISGKSSKLSPFLDSKSVTQENIEKIINGEITTAERTRLAEVLGEAEAQKLFDGGSLTEVSDRQQTAASLQGFSSVTRATGGIGEAENMLEVFEDMIWGRPEEDLELQDRRADDPDLNPFDIYIAYGDFAGDNRVNHTIQKLTDVYIVGSAKQIEITGMPIQEQYTFIARNQI